MKKYKLVSKQGEGTFSEVVKAENIENGNFYAIKCMKNSFKSLQQVCTSSGPETLSCQIVGACHVMKNDAIQSKGMKLIFYSL